MPGNPAIKKTDMFQHHIESFGDFRKHILRSADGADEMAFVPEYGACLLELQLRGVNVLDGYTSPEEMLENRWGKNIVLYPFPNRLKEGRYQWHGKTYQFPINNPDTGNALHGFGWDRPMEVVDITLEEGSCAVTCVREESGGERAYPFAFRFSITFQLWAGGKFEVTLGFENRSDVAVPVGMGWHPYFALSAVVDAMELRFPPCEAVEIDQYMIPTGRLLPEARFAQATRIGDTVLDNCFRLAPEPGWAEVTLHGEKGILRYAQETGTGKFNFLQVFTPPHRQSVAIEPMTCNIDAFNNGQGLIALDPGASARARARVSLEK